jgi:hypothetical protein
MTVFVTYLLRYTNIMTIRELERRLKDYIVYQGSLRAITYLEQEDVSRDEFFHKRRMLCVVGDTVYHFRKVVTRVLQA